jgi:hypothetical protein
MSRYLSLAALALLLAWGGCALWRGLASDETQIRWRIEEVTEAFNAGRPGSAVKPLADAWWDKTSGIHKDTLHQLLVGMLFREKDAQGRFRYAVEVPAETLVIEVLDDGTAHATLEASFFRKRNELRELKWRVAVEADFVDGDDGWEIVATEHWTLAGTPH